MLKRFRPYLRYLRPARWSLAFGILAGVLAGIAGGAGIPVMTKTVFPILFQDQEGMEDVPQWMLDFVDRNFGSSGQDILLLVSCALIPAVILLRSIGLYFNGYLINKVGFVMLEGLRTDVFAKLQSLPLAFYHRHRSGDLLARVTSDSAVLRKTIVQGASDLVTQPVTLVSAVAVLVYNAVQNEGFFVVLIALFSVPLCIIPIRMVGKKLISRAREIQATTGKLSEILTETLQSPIEVRTYNLQEERKELFRGRIRKLMHASLKRIKYEKLISPSIELVGALGFALALFIGVRIGMGLGQFLLVASALYISYEPVKKLGRLNALAKHGQAALERIEEILYAADSLPEPDRPERPAEFTPTVEFQGVDFSYGGPAVVHGLNLAVAEGETVALVGSSGAGKSTVVTLVPRLYDVTKGMVAVSGLDVRAWSKAELRSQVAFVPQQPALFAVSVAANIRAGRPGATDGEVREAARLAHAEEFINELENGYDTMVGERGSQISGGQRQRIALARAFLKNAPILILDEATSALDSESESRIQEALATLVKGKTTFIVAHRFSTLSLATRILVMDEGRLVGDGRHEALLESCTVYRTLYDRQAL